MQRDHGAQDSCQFRACAAPVPYTTYSYCQSREPQRENSEPDRVSYKGYPGTPVSQKGVQPATMDTMARVCGIKKQYLTRANAWNNQVALPTQNHSDRKHSYQSDHHYQRAGHT